MKFFFHDIQVRKKTFLLVYGIGIGKLKGSLSRTHVNSATKQAISFPGGHPNLDDIKVQLLPSSETKASTWRQYKKVSEEKNLSAVSYNKFVDLWKSLTPYIVIMKPTSDLCSLCQLNNSKIKKRVNSSE